MAAHGVAAAQCEHQQLGDFFGIDGGGQGAHEIEQCALLLNLLVERAIGGDCLLMGSSVVQRGGSDAEQRGEELEFRRVEVAGGRAAETEQAERVSRVADGQRW